MPVTLQRLSKYWWCQVDDDGLDIPLTEVNQLNALGEAPIHIAAWKGLPEDVQWLLENGANVNQLGEFGMTPLHYAYMGDRQENVTILLDAGADPKVKCESGLLPHEGRKEKS